jgi:SWI/SNF-related matrix-associated actin-dependent regulator of chromatin subfamily A protein 2/4
MKLNRLITEDELPDWLKNDVDQVEKTLENDEDFGKGRRQRKDIDYGDNLTEREFLQALEEGNLDDAVEQKRIKKQNRKNLQDDDIDLDETEARSSFDNPSTPISNQQNVCSKRGSIKKRLETIDPKITSQCRLLIDHLLAYRTDDDRQLAQIFIRLPGQKQLPLYYQIIEEPIDFQRIRRKIDTYRYSSLEQLDSDMKLLVENAQTFNCETSIIYSDSILLGKIYDNLREQLQSGLLPIQTETTAIADEPATTTTTTSRNSARRGRGARTAIPVITNTSGVSRRGRKRKATVVKEEENASADERVLSDNGDNQED